MERESRPDPNSERKYSKRASAPDCDMRRLDLRSMKMHFGGRSHGRGRPRHTILAVKVGSAVPHELDGDGEDQKAENLVNGSDRVGTQPPHQRTA